MIKRTIVYVVAYLAIAFLFTGCTQYKAIALFTGTEQLMGTGPVAAKVDGVWSGSITIPDKGNTVPRAQNFSLNIVQDGNNLDGIGSIDYTGTMAARVFGDIGEKEIHLTLNEGNWCNNKFSVNGEVHGTQMVVHIDGPGNRNDSCYDKPIHTTITLQR